MSLNLQQLRCFTAVAEHGSFTAAARALGMGQPGVTTHVKALEGRFGVELFLRRGSSVRLSQAGEVLLQSTRRLLAIEREAEEGLRAAGGLLTGELRLTAFNPMQAVQLLLAFRARHPGVRLAVTLGNTRTMVDALLGFQADVATVPQRDDPRLALQPFARMRIALLVPRGHRWARRRRVRVAELAGQPFVMREDGSHHQQVFAERLQALGVRVDTRLVTDSQEVVREAVAAGLGLGIALGIDLAFDPRLVAVPLDDLGEFPVLQIACLAERREAPLIRAFFATLAPLTGR